MPMRRISTGLTRVGFDQDPSPLTEGMLHAASTLGELWPRLKQIEMEKKQHQDSVDERKQRYDQESQDRAAALAERKQERDDALENQKTNHADYLKTAGDTANRNAEENQFKHNVELAKMGVVGDEGQLWQNAAAFANKKLAREETQANHAVYTFFTDKDGNTYRRNTHTGEVDHIDPNDKRASATPQAAPVDPQQAIDNTAVAGERTGLRGFGNLWGALGPSRQEIIDRANHNVDVINRTNMRKGPPQATGSTQADSPSQLWAPSPAVPQAKQASANRPVDQLWPSTPSNLPPGVTPDDPRIAPDSEPQPADDYVIGMHELAQKDPARFKASLLDLKAKNPSAYAATAKRLREMDGATGAK